MLQLLKHTAFRFIFYVFSSRKYNYFMIITVEFYNETEMKSIQFTSTRNIKSTHKKLK